MRSRKPCFLARRRLLGWNVRLLTGTPGMRETHADSQPTAPIADMRNWHPESRTVVPYAEVPAAVNLQPSCQPVAVPGRGLHMEDPAAGSCSPPATPGRPAAQARTMAPADPGARRGPCHAAPLNADASGGRAPGQPGFLNHGADAAGIPPAKLTCNVHNLWINLLITLGARGGG